jgi:integrase
MGRKASGTSIEIQPGLYLSSHDGLLHCYFRIEGRAFRRSTRTNDIAEATERAETWYRDAQFRASLGDRLETVSFKRLAAAYEHHITGLSKATYQLPTIQRHFLPYFASVQDITKIRTPELMAYMDHRRAKTPSPTPQTLNRENSVLRQMLRYAHDCEWIKAIPRLPNLSERQTRRRRRHFTLDEYETLISVADQRAEACRDYPTKRLYWQRSLLRDYIIVLANTGLRVDESKTVIWRNVDFQEGTVLLEHAGKTRSSRRALIREPGIAALRAIQERRLAYLQAVAFDPLCIPMMDANERVFSMPDGQFVLCYKTAFRHLLDACGFEYRDAKDRHVLTSLRHTYATLRLTTRTGIRASVKALSKQMGTSERMIERHYGHDQILDYRDELLS